MFGRPNWSGTPEPFASCRPSRWPIRQVGDIKRQCMGSQRRTAAGGAVERVSTLHLVFPALAPDVPVSLRKYRPKGRYQPGWPGKLDVAVLGLRGILSRESDSSSLSSDHASRRIGQSAVGRPTPCRHQHWSSGRVASDSEFGCCRKNNLLHHPLGWRSCRFRRTPHRVRPFRTCTWSPGKPTTQPRACLRRRPGRFDERSRYSCIGPNLLVAPRQHRSTLGRVATGERRQSNQLGLASANFPAA